MNNPTGTMTAPLSLKHELRKRSQPGELRELALAFCAFIGLTALVTAPSRFASGTSPTAWLYELVGTPD